MRALRAPLLFVVVLAACPRVPSSPDAPCNSDVDCSEREVCADGVCRAVGARPDGGDLVPTDGGGVDAALADDAGGGDGDGDGDGDGGVGCVDVDGDGRGPGCALGEDACPAIAFEDPHDEDGDAVPDVCDVCPMDADPDQSDVLELSAGEMPDAVGDVCDPRPASGGDALIRFDPFTGAGAFTTLSCAWIEADDELVVDASIEKNCRVAFDDEPLADVLVDARLVVDGFGDVATGNVGVGVSWVDAAGGTDGSACALTATNLVAYEIVDGSAAATARAPHETSAPIVARLRGGGAASELACRTDERAVFGPVTTTRVDGSVGLRVNDASARFAAFAVYALGGALPLPDVEDGPVHRYSFDDDADGASDSASGADGALLGGASIADGRLELDGIDDYVDLPNGIISILDEISVEAWVEYRGAALGDWQRIFDFGTNDVGEITAPGGGPFSGNTTRFIQLSPETQYGTTRLTIFDGQDAFLALETDPLPLDVPVHVAITYAPAVGTAVLYVNGAEQARGEFFLGLDEIDDVNVWLGRSNYSVDPSFNGAMDEIRIWPRALTPAEVHAGAALGPTTLP
jgi:hypothetical protein